MAIPNANSEKGSVEMREMNERGCKKCKRRTRSSFFTASSFSLVLDFPLKPENFQSIERNRHHWRWRTQSHSIVWIWTCLSRHTCWLSSCCCSCSCSAASSVAALILKSLEVLSFMYCIRLTCLKTFRDVASFFKGLCNTCCCICCAYR